MRIYSQQNNEISLEIDPGETIYFRGELLRGRSFGVPLLPPYPLGSPIARLLHGCYYLNRVSRSEDHHLLQLTGDRAMGRFRLITLAAQDRYFVNPRYLAGFCFGPGGGLHTQLQRLVSPSCWGIGHPLPVIAHGPGAVIVYADNLYEKTALDASDAEYIPAQVVAFDARQAFRTRTLRPDHSPLSQLFNALIDDNRICFTPGARLFASPINHPFGHRLRLLVQVALHLALIPAILYVMHLQ